MYYFMAPTEIESVQNTVMYYFKAPTEIVSVLLRYQVLKMHVCTFIV